MAATEDIAPGAPAPVPDEDDLARFIGTELPGGQFTFEPWWVHLVNDCAQAPPEDGAASPVFVFLAGTAAMGVTWEQLWAMFGATEADGPMAGETSTNIHRPPQVGTTYTVRGRITDARRKRGARTGVFDVVEYRLDLHEPGGEPAASSTNSILFPRRNL